MHTWNQSCEAYLMNLHVKNAKRFDDFQAKLTKTYVF